MDKNKGDAGNIAELINLEPELTKPIQSRIDMKNLTTTTNRFQYPCSFCARELPNGGIRFDGIGACPNCNRLAHQLVNALRMHRTNYFSNLGVKR